MPRTPVLWIFRPLLAAAALLFVLALPVEVRAQQVVVVVNGDPVTGYDIEQRVKLIQVSGAKPPGRDAVVKELIDEKIKIQLLRRYVMDTIDTEVNNAYTNMAHRMRLTPKQFTDRLSSQGVSAVGLKSRIKAEIVWGQIIRGKFQSSFQFADKEILAKLGTNADKPLVGYDYTLRPVLFVVPKGSPESVAAARRREAEALRGRFQGCSSGIIQARGLRDVAVRPPVVRSSADLPPGLRELLEKTEIGKLTPPEVTAQGIQVYALCAKKESAADNLPGKREVRDQMMKEQYELHSKQFLKELRSQALIEYK